MRLPALKSDARIEVAFIASAAILSVQRVPYLLYNCVSGPDNGPTSMFDLAAGVASTPYQYRALVPWLVRGAVAAHLLRPEAQGPAFWVANSIAFIALAVVFRAYLSLFIAARSLTSIAALSLLVLVPFDYYPQPFFPYDIPSIMLFTLGLIFVYRRNWLAYYPLFAIMTLNRETSVLLVAVCALVLFDVYDRRRLAALVLSQLAIWAAIKAALWALYRGNLWIGHQAVWFPMEINLRVLMADPLRLFLTLATWGALLLAVVLLRRRLRDEWLRRTLWAIPISFASTVAFGFIAEMRIDGEVLPIALAAVWVVVFDVVAGERGDKSQTDRSRVRGGVSGALAAGGAVPDRSLSSADAGR